MLTASRVVSVISNCTGRCVFCCSTIARDATTRPWQTSRARSFAKSHALSLLSVARYPLSRAGVVASCNTVYTYIQ